MSSIHQSLPGVRKVNSPVSEDWCHTILKVKTFKCNWTIDHFGCREEFIESSIFPAGFANEVPKWNVRAYPRGRSENYKDYLALGIVAHCKSPVRAKFKLSILNDNGEEFESVNSQICYFSQQGDSSYFKDFVTRNDLLNVNNGLLPQDTLTVLCEVSVINESENISGQSSIAQLKVADNKMSEDLGKMFKNEEFSDFKLVAGGREFVAHKTILAARSKVFAAMFRHPMKERELRQVSIPDILPEVLEELLYYVYTAKSPNLNTMAEDLLAAADKYELETLKDMCEESLRINITIEKAANTLLLADQHNAGYLKSQTMNFIINNATNVLETQGWKDMVTTHSHLIAEAFRAFASK